MDTWLQLLVGAGSAQLGLAHFEERRKQAGRVHAKKLFSCGGGGDGVFFGGAPPLPGDCFRGGPPKLRSIAGRLQDPEWRVKEVCLQAVAKLPKEDLPNYYAKISHMLLDTHGTVSVLLGLYSCGHRGQLQVKKRLFDSQSDSEVTCGAQRDSFCSPLSLVAKKTENVSLQSLLSHTHDDIFLLGLSCRPFPQLYSADIVRIELTRSLSLPPSDRHTSISNLVICQTSQRPRNPK